MEQIFTQRHTCTFAVGSSFSACLFISSSQAVSTPLHYFAMFLFCFCLYFSHHFKILLFFPWTFLNPFTMFFNLLFLFSVPLRAHKTHSLEIMIFFLLFLPYVLQTHLSHYIVILPRCPFWICLLCSLTSSLLFLFLSVPRSPLRLQRRGDGGRPWQAACLLRDLVRLVSGGAPTRPGERRRLQQQRRRFGPSGGDAAQRRAGRSQAVGPRGHHPAGHPQHRLREVRRKPDTHRIWIWECGGIVQWCRNLPLDPNQCHFK